MFDIPIHRRKTSVMQRMQHAVSRGYIFYTSGLISPKKAMVLSEKFSDLYHINFNKNQRAYAKKKGNSNSMLFLYPRKNEDRLLWWLLSTNGEGKVHKLENLYNVYDKKNRLIWDDDYEIILLNKEGVSKEVVTWRMTKKCYKNWHERVRTSIRNRYSNDDIKQTIWSLYRCPGFSEIRSQVKKISYQFDKEWQRSRGIKEEKPNIPKRIGFVRATKENTVPLSLVCKRMISGKRPFPNIKS